MNNDQVTNNDNIQSTNLTPNDNVSVVNNVASENSTESLQSAPVIPVVSMAGNSTPAPVKEEKKDDVITSGTASEEEINIDASKESVEVLDEYEINKNTIDAKNADKKKILFIFVIFLIFFLFVVFLRPLIKWIGI